MKHANDNYEFDQVIMTAFGLIGIIKDKFVYIREEDNV